MINPIKWWKNRRQQKRKQRETLQTIHLWAWLEKLFDGGQLSFDYEHHRLFITQPMAVLMMQNGADGWVQSVRNIYAYVHWRQTQAAFDEFIRKKEMAAVRDAMQELKNPKQEGTAVENSKLSALNSQLTRDDIDRIKRTSRQEIAFSDMPIPKTEPFEFFIIPDSTDAKVEPIAVGYYDPESDQMDVATWDDVRHLLNT